MSHTIETRGGLRRRGGGLRRPGGGIVRVPAPGAAGPSYTLNTLTSADVAAIISKAEPNVFWDAGVASGAEDLVGSDDLSDIDAPTKEVDDAILGGLCTTLIGLSGDSIRAASSSVADVTTQTLTGILILRYTETATGTVRGVLCKRNTIAGNNGYELFSQNRNLAMVYDTPSGVSVRTIAADHGTANGQVILFTRSIANSATNIYSREGSATGGANAGTLSSIVDFALGASALRGSNPGFNIAKAMLWLGTNGDDFDETERSLLATALGIE